MKLVHWLSDEEKLASLADIMQRRKAGTLDENAGAETRIRFFARMSELDQTGASKEWVVETATREMYEELLSSGLDLTFVHWTHGKHHPDYLREPWYRILRPEEVHV